MEKREKQEALNEREQKQRVTLFKNELILNQRKEEIMNKINEKEKNLQKAKEERKRLNLLEQEEKFQKKLIKEDRVKQISQLLENRREKIRRDLNEKDKRVEQFMQNKIKMVRKKRDMFDEINEEKHLNNEEFEKMLSKKNIDRNILNSIKEMFPYNKQIDDIIDEFNVHLDKNEKNKMNNFNYEI